MDGERHGDMSPASLLCGDSGMIFSKDTDSNTARHQVRRSRKTTIMRELVIMVTITAAVI